MSDERAGFTDWMWWGGLDDECYTVGPCVDRDQVIAEGTGAYGEKGFHIVEAKKPASLSLADQFDVDRFLEDVEDRVYEDHANEQSGAPVFDITGEQKKSLKAAIHAGIAGWQAAHSLEFQGWKFSAQRNEEFIPGTGGA